MGNFKMNIIGFIGTIGVIAQMALLSLGYAPALAMFTGLLASACWVAYAVNKNDKWLLAVNMSVFGFATYGLAFS